MAISGLSDLRRRQLLLAAGGLIVAPLHAAAQPAGRAYRIGILSPTDAESGMVDAMRTELRNLGWAEGRDILVDARGAKGDVSRLAAFAAEFVRAPADVIVSLFTPATHAATRATRTIPIVFAMVADPVGSGFVASLGRPGGNATGLTNIVPDLGGKLLELLREAVPGASRIALLWNPTEPANAPVYREAAAAASSLGLALLSFEARDVADLEPSFAQMGQKGAQALFLIGDRLTFIHRRRIADLALAHRLPTIFSLEGYVTEGGLMFYGPSLPDAMRRVAQYVDRILKGAAPASLPVERPAKLDLLINLKTARALGLSLPRSILLRADRVIE